MDARVSTWKERIELALEEQVCCWVELLTFLPVQTCLKLTPHCILYPLRIKIHLLILVRMENKSLIRFHQELTVWGLHLLVRLLVANQSTRLQEHSLPCSNW